VSKPERHGEPSRYLVEKSKNKKLEKGAKSQRALIFCLGLAGSDGPIRSLGAKTSIEEL
jgi:hypothetical protein